MFLRFADRPSDSPYIERVWRGRSDGGGPFVSVAAGHLELVVTRLPDFAMVTLRGPETRATTIDCPPDGEWAAIRFRLGVHMPALPTHLLVDHHDVHLPVAADGSFTTRSVQRHFRRTTGMTHGLFRQIERARHATILLRDGASILDTVHEAGYFDQAHLTRSLKVLIGETPASVLRHDAQLSFLYKTSRPASG
jgi:AraC-like DNA-binding protein